MKPVITGAGRWRIAVSAPPAAAAFAADRWLRESVPARGNPASSAVAVAVEVLRVGSGVTPRALVGGAFEPGGSLLRLDVGSSGDLTSGAPAHCASLLGRPLVSGLPEEFAQAALDGLVRIAGSVSLPPGALRIDAAAYDEADSSSLAFERAAGALAWVIEQKYQPDGVLPEALSALVGAW